MHLFLILSHDFCYLFTRWVYCIVLYNVLVPGLHLALSDPRTLGDVDFTIAHPNLPKISIKNTLGAHCAPKLIPITRTLPAFFLKNTHPWVRTAHPDEGLVGTLPG